jgi:hypothetical protein
MEFCDIMSTKEKQAEKNYAQTKIPYKNNVRYHIPNPPDRLRKPAGLFRYFSGNPAE